jgi:hypothetical protein
VYMRMRMLVRNLRLPGSRVAPALPIAAKPGLPDQGNKITTVTKEISGTLSVLCDVCGTRRYA